MRSLKGFVVEPIFFDALSGEFALNSDISNRHTLGRLAIATYTKGIDMDSILPYSRFLYTPSWIKVESEIVCVHAGSLFLEELHLRSSSEESFSIKSTKNTDFEPSLSLEINEEQVLLIDQELSHSAATRATVARHAQTFFDRISV
ncbi:MAG TPA: hypothetical protein VMV24_00025 [Candidatus Dormibacteraeota bacterium]|nr:hypothetical protein [Candidatus Dormibacteraeota bacterium]